MAFKRILAMDIWEIVRRYKAGQTIRNISEALGYDRKTVRKYIRHLQEKGISLRDDTPIEKEEVAVLLRQVAAETERPADKQALFEPYLEELKELIGEPSGMKPKTAFKVLCGRHNLTGKVSYTSFKRFVRSNELVLNVKEITCRIETDPGDAMQVDYFKAGLLYDPVEGRMRTVYGFIGTLSYSRHKFIEFVFRQDQQSFVGSHVKAFDYFGGIPKRIVLDNLKAGVIRPDLYDPQFNRAYREMAEHYNTFLDPARVKSPKDKGKVERDVQTVREKFKEITALYPTITLAELNQRILMWLRDDYGLTKHGTTHQMPYRVFQEEEQPKLIPLPRDQFEAAFWKEATVHPDCYIQVKKKSYSVPYQYAGKKVWVKVSNNIVQVFFNEELIKEHIVLTRGYRKTDPIDFPDNLAAAVDKGLPHYLQSEAAKIGPQFESLVRSVLTLHAFINLRRAQGIVSVAKSYQPEIVEQVAANLMTQPFSFTPKYFKASIEKLVQLEYQSQEIPLSDETKTFVRDPEYFNHTS
jgi:transposase